MRIISHQFTCAYQQIYLCRRLRDDSSLQSCYTGFLPDSLGHFIFR